MDLLIIRTAWASALNDGNGAKLDGIGCLSRVDPRQFATLKSSTTLPLGFGEVL
jgi:hypothetical protein